MASLRPEPNIGGSTGSRVSWLMAALAWLSCGTVWAQSPLPELQPDAPITIDAESSEFDYGSNRLLFRGLRLDQGTLGIRADEAVTDKLDFTNGVWNFEGNVVIELETAQLYCDSATLSFKDHQLITASLSGAPAKFEQHVPESDLTNMGEALQIDYQFSTGTLELRESARFSDGSNEISGDLISYAITARRITAGSGDSGPVKILIEPPTTNEAPAQ